MRTFAFVAVWLLLGTHSVYGTLVTRTENFDSDPGWSILGNGVNGNNFGYQSSSFAGGAAGEGGGHFTRSLNQRSYSDSDLNGSLTLDDPLSASGRFAFTSSNTPDFGTFLVIGYHRSVQSASLMGINVGNGQGGPLRLFGLLQLSDGVYVSTPEITPTVNVPLTWSFDWDPTGGVNALGRYSVTIAGNSSFVDLTASQRAAGATFDAFGINGFNNNSSASAAENADFFIDDVSYNALAPVPEPASLVTLVGLGVFAGCFYSARPRRANLTARPLVSHT